MTRSRNSRKGNLTSLEERIMLVLDIHPGLDDVEIAEVLGAVPVEVSIALRRLETLGLVAEQKAAHQAPREEA